MARQNGHAQRNQLAYRSRQESDGYRRAQLRWVHLHREQPQADEAATCRGRRGNLHCRFYVISNRRVPSWFAPAVKTASYFSIGKTQFYPGKSTTCLSKHVSPGFARFPCRYAKLPATARYERNSEYNNYVCSSHIAVFPAYKVVITWYSGLTVSSCPHILLTSLYDTPVIGIR